MEPGEGLLTGSKNSHGAFIVLFSTIVTVRVFHNTHSARANREQIDPVPTHLLLLIIGGEARTVTRAETLGISSALARIDVPGDPNPNDNLNPLRTCCK